MSRMHTIFAACGLAATSLRPLVAQSAVPVATPSEGRVPTIEARVKCS